MSKVYVGVGHGGTDPGAVGFLVEKEVNLKMALACRDYLVKRGVSVLMAREDDSTVTLTESINKCNAYNPDLALECHNNAGKGNGFEVYHSLNGVTGKILAKNIEEEVIRLGQNSRGLKTRKGSTGSDYYGFIRLTVCPAVICEGAFVDHPEDYKMIDTDEKCKAFGEAYARGVLKTLGIEDTVIVTPPDETEPAGNKGYLVKITTDALNIRRGPGINFEKVGMITDRGVYTIMEEKEADGYTWGRLKSGAGWIALKYTKKL